MKKPFFSSRPKTLKESMSLFLKGLCMGSADIIPGVSGGTIALITGIYEQLLTAVKSIDIYFFRKLLKLEIKKAFVRVHLRFLLILFSGIAIAIISIARLMNFLLKSYPEPTFSLFIGLIVASIFVIGKQVKWNLSTVLSIVSGTVIAYTVVGLIPVNTPVELWFIFLSGVIGICAMILPGLSGAFILLIIGKYGYITGTLKDPFSTNEVSGTYNMLIILIFCIGCATGLAGFSRLLNWLLAKWHNSTLAFLTGLMAGSIRKIWPWKGEAVTKIIRGKEHIISQNNIIPQTFDTNLIVSIVLTVVGIAVILLLDKKTKKETTT